MFQADPQTVARSQARGHLAGIFTFEYSGRFFPRRVTDHKIVEPIGGDGPSGRAVTITGKERDLVVVTNLGNGLKG